MLKVSDIRKEFEKFIIIKDKWILDMVMATMIANTSIQRDPLWLMIVGVSSGGKSTFIAPCDGVPTLRFVDDITEKTFLSGFKIKGQDQSLLKQMGSGILAFSDFTSILSKNPMSKGEILTQMKLIYDGVLTKSTGTGTLQWKGKMGFIGGATPDVYQHMEAGRSMGERFLYYWLEQPTDEEISKKQGEVALSSKAIADNMKPLYKEYVENIRAWIDKHGMPPLRLTQEQKQSVRYYAMFCVNGKATVHLDYKTGKPDAIPNKAGVGRDYKAFETLLHTLQVMRAYETNDWDTGVTEDHINLVKKIAYSSINRERRKILEILCSEESAMTASEIGAIKGLGLPKDSIDKHIIPLHAIGLVEKEVYKNGSKWKVTDIETRNFVNSVSETMGDKLDTTVVLPMEEDAEDDVGWDQNEIDEYNKKLI